MLEQEGTDGSIEIIDSEPERSKGTAPSEETKPPSSSGTQIIQRQMSVEASSFSRPVEQDKSIKDKFKEIKMRNERLKVETYAQLFKLSTPSQNRLMSSFDIKEGNMKVSFIQPTMQQPRTPIDYKKVDFEVLARDIHPMDQIEFHKQAGQIIYSTLTRMSIAVHQLQIYLNNISAQYQLE